MKWKKIGKIFDFSQSAFKDDFIGFAQSPQALVFDDFVRIYFSTRQKSENGKFISIIQFIDMDKGFSYIKNFSTHNVIDIGELGTFDEHGIFPMTVFKHDNLIYSYTNGWSRRVSVSVDTAIGMATSKDNGFTFEKFGSGPVLASSLHEPYLVCDPFVRVFDSVFHMWYIYGTNWKIFEDGCEPDRTYVIAHAISKDGINWTKDGRSIIPQTHSDECQALPTVIKIKNIYHMYFCHRHSFDFRKNPKNAYQLGYAYSYDLVNWIRDDANKGIDKTAGDWDSDMMCYPHIFECDSRIYLLYNGNEFGKDGFGIAELEDC
jgi:hypothetical protein